MSFSVKVITTAELWNCAHANLPILVNLALSLNW